VNRHTRDYSEYWENEPRFEWESEAKADGGADLTGDEVAWAEVEAPVEFNEADAETFERNFPRRDVEIVAEEGVPFDVAVDVDAATMTADAGEEGVNVQEVRSNANTAAMEKQILELVNGERVRRGLRPLVWDGRLCQAGRDHSRDMGRRNYFSHYSPNGSSVTERVIARGADFRWLGENIAMDFSARSAHQNLMRSRGHRDNILKREYRRVGIGVSVSPRGELLVTQVFSG
jgi:uncharacterized protein YkwD